VPITAQTLRELHSQVAAGLVRGAPDPLAEQAASYEYRVAPHDVLSVVVWNHPELTIPAGEFRSAEASGHPVTVQGTMFYPYVGMVDVAGKTLPEIRADLTHRLKATLNDPQLDVKVAAFRGLKVQVTGEVKTPATLPITDVPLRALDAIALTQGPTLAANLRQVLLSRGGQIHRLDLQAVNERGDTSQNWLLQHGDLLHVPDNSQNKVFVLGEVDKPRSRLMINGRMTLAEALSDEDGLRLATANAGGVYVIRGTYDRPRVFQLDARSPDALLLASNFPLQPMDVVFVSAHDAARWNRVVEQIWPTAQLVTQPAFFLRNIFFIP